MTFTAIRAAGVLSVVVATGGHLGAQETVCSDICAPPVQVTIAPKRLIVRSCCEGESERKSKKGCWLFRKCKSKKSSAPAAAPATFMAPIVYSPLYTPMRTIGAAPAPAAPTNYALSTIMAAQQAELALTELSAAQAAQKSALASTNATIKRIQEQLSGLGSGGGGNDGGGSVTTVDLSDVKDALERITQGQADLKGRLINNAGVSQSIGAKLVEMDSRLGKVEDRFRTDKPGSIADRLKRLDEHLGRIDESIEAIGGNGKAPLRDPKENPAGAAPVPTGAPAPVESKPPATVPSPPPREKLPKTKADEKTGSPSLGAIVTPKRAAIPVLVIPSD